MASRDPETLPIGTILGHRFELKEKLGSGGMGTVYRAHDIKLGNDKALKVAKRGDLNLTPLEETQIAHKVTHRNVCRIYDVLSDGNDLTLISMELVRGRSLRDVLSDDYGPDIDKKRQIARQICEGLAAIHEKNIIHRDLKPENVLCGYKNGVKISDFGIAVEARRSSSAEFAGTYQYMAPELWDSPPRITRQSDLYALGIILFELFTGRWPFYLKETEELKAWHLQEMPPHPSTLNGEIPRALGDAILACLAKNPLDRPSSVGELLPFFRDHPAPKKFSQRFVVSADLSRYSDVARSAYNIFGDRGVAELDGLVRGLFEQAVRSVGLEPDEIPIKIAADGAIVLFESPSHAHSFARALHESGQQLRAQRKDGQGTIEEKYGSDLGFFRIGIDSGTVQVGAPTEDFSGLSVTNASRLEQAAETGQTLITQRALEALIQNPGSSTHSYGPLEIISGKRKEALPAHRARHTEPAPWESLPVVLSAQGLDSSWPSDSSWTPDQIAGSFLADSVAQGQSWRFYSAVDATRFTLALWRETASLADSAPLQSFGIAEDQGSDASNLANSLAEMARVGSSLLTGDAFAQCQDHEGLGASTRLHFFDHGKYRVDGHTEPLGLGEIAFDRTAFERLTGNKSIVPLQKQEGEWTWFPNPEGHIPNAPNWKLVRKLGEGAYGQVWLAQSLESDQDLSAFKFFLGPKGLEAVNKEIEVLQILEEDETANGSFVRPLQSDRETSPYFIRYEWAVQGNLSEWVEKADLFKESSLERRVEIAESIASNLEQVHGAGVLHHDLKPSNILVFGELEQPVFLLTDFGLGRAAEDAPADGSSLPSVSSMTLRYAPPEFWDEKSSQPTAASDVYSLGVLLFQFAVSDFRKAVLPGWEKDIHNEVLLEDLSGMLASDPSDRPDLGYVVERLASFTDNVLEAEKNALEKERAEEQRKRELAELSEKEERDQKNLITGIAALIAILAIVASSLAVNAYIAWDRESIARQAYEDTLRFLTQSFEVSDPTTLSHPKDSKGKTVTVFELLDVAYNRQKVDLKDQPRVRGSVLNTIGSIYRNLGIFDKAGIRISESLLVREEAGDESGVVESLLSQGLLQYSKSELVEAVQTLESALGLEEAADEPRPAVLSEVLSTLGAALTERGDYETAKKLTERALDLSKELLKAEDINKNRARAASVLAQLGTIRAFEGELEEAEKNLRQALAELRPDYDYHPLMASLMDHLAVFLIDNTDRFDEAREYFNESLQIRRAAFREEDSDREEHPDGEKYPDEVEHPDVVQSQVNLAVLEIYAGNFEAAHSWLDKATSLQSDIFGDTDHLGSASIAISRGLLHLYSGELTEAENQFNKALRIQRNILGNKHKDIAVTMNYLATIRIHTGDYQEATDLLEAVDSMQQDLFVKYNRERAQTLSTLGRLLEAQADFDGAEAKLCEVLSIWDHLGLEDKDPQVISTKLDLAAVYNSTGAIGQAEPLSRDVLTVNKKSLGREHPETALAFGDLAFLLIGKADLLAAKGDSDAAEKAFAEAERLFEESLGIYRKAHGGDTNLAVIRTLKNMGLLYERWGNLEKAEDHYSQALALEQDPDAAFNRAKTLSHMARLELIRGNPSEAINLADDALGIFRQTLDRDHWRVANAESIRAAAEFTINADTGLQSTFVENFEIIKTAKGETSFYTRDALKRLIDFYRGVAMSDKQRDYEEMREIVLSTDLVSEQVKPCPESESALAK